MKNWLKLGFLCKLTLNYFINYSYERQPYKLRENKSTASNARWEDKSSEFAENWHYNGFSLYPTLGGIVHQLWTNIWWKCVFTTLRSAMASIEIMLPIKICLARNFQFISQCSQFHRNFLSAYILTLYGYLLLENHAAKNRLMWVVKFTQLVRLHV